MSSDTGSSRSSSSESPSADGLGVGEQSAEALQYDDGFGAEIGVGPHPLPYPEGERYDPELLAQGDRRNVGDEYRYWTRRRSSPIWIFGGTTSM